MASWDYDSDRGIFDVVADYPGNVLFVTAYAGIACMKLRTALGIDDGKLQRLIRTVESRYMDVPYHSSIHGADVVHGTFWIVEHGGLGKMLEPLHKLALMVSACAHDMDHPGQLLDLPCVAAQPVFLFLGTSNVFQIKTNSAAALRYNDVSVLENM